MHAVVLHCLEYSITTSFRNNKRLKIATVLIIVPQQSHFLLPKQRTYPHTIIIYNTQERSIIVMMIRSTNLLFFCGLSILLSATGLIVVQSFTTNTKSISTFGGVTSRISSISSDGRRTLMSSPSSSPLGTVLHMAGKDPSKSGTKKERMNRLAEMEELGVASGDRSVFVKAAGGFVAVIVIAIAAAASQGLLTPI